MATKIQLRRDLAASWTSSNPILAQGEPGLETDTGKIKYGTGTTAWVDLDYASSGGGVIDGNLDVSRTPQGWAATISTVGSGYVYHDATVLHSGNLYLAGGFYSSFADSDDGFNNDAMVLSKISTDGEVLASKMVWESSQNSAYGDGVTVNPTTGNIVVSGAQYRGGSYKFIRHEINANLTVVSSRQYSFLGDAWAWVVGSDLMPNDDTVTCGGQWGGNNIVYSNVTVHPGSYTSYLGVDITDTFGSNTLPSLNNGWSITGNGISGGSNITGINFFFANESSSTSADGYGSDWDITYTPGSNVYVVSDYYGGQDYQTGDVVTIHGNELGGNITTNDLSITVGNVNGSGSILTYSLSGVAQTELIWFRENTGVNFGNTAGRSWNIQQSTSDNVWVITDDWARTIGGSSWENARSIATDLGGNVYITMEADSGSDTRDGTKAGVVKLNSSGVHQWTKFVDFGQYNNPQGIAVDSTGNVVVSARTNNGYGAVAKLNPTTGNMYWRTTIGTDGDNSDWMGFSDLTNPVFDSTGNIIVAGEFNSYISTSDDILVMSFNSNTGAVNWQRAISNSGDQNITWDNGHKTLACDGDNYYVTYYNNSNNDSSTTVKLPVDGTTPGVLAGELVYQEQDWITNTAVNITSVNDDDGYIEVSSMLVTTTTPATSLIDLIDLGYASNDTRTLGIGATGYVKGVTNLEFEDGTSISTAPQTAQSEFAGDNYETMRIEVYNGGKNLYWDGDSDVEWFNSYNAPGAGQGWQVTGAIIEYQLYDDNNYGTQVGTIHASGFYDDSGEATHTEHYTSDSSGMEYNQPWILNSNNYNNVRLLYRGEPNNSYDVKIQWTARVFYGQENNC